MRHTIRHDSTRRTILAYLAATDRTTRALRICDYMRLMHRTSKETTKQTLARLAREGTIERVRRGYYRSTLEIA